MYFSTADSTRLPFNLSHDSINSNEVYRSQDLRQNKMAEIFLNYGYKLSHVVIEEHCMN